MDSIFQSRHHRRVFILVCVLVVVVLSLTRVWLAYSLNDQDPSKIVVSIIPLIDSILAGLVASMLVGLVMYFFSPKREDPQKIKCLHASEIVPNFEKALKEARGWFFLGNRGRYLRSKVLPSLSTRTGAFTVDAIFIDPTDINACNRFVEYKIGENGDGEEFWSVERLQVELLSTLVVCAWYMKFNSLTVNIYLSDKFSQKRVDSSVDKTFITVENKREPCLMVIGDHFYNDWIKANFSLAKNQSRIANLTPIHKNRLLDICEDDIEKICDEVGFTERSAEIISLIKEEAVQNEDPYGRG